MKKHLLRIFTVLVLSIIMISNMIPEVYGIIPDSPESYISSDTDNQAIVPIGSVIVGIVRAVGIALSILILVIVGIKYIIGSTQERAEYKQTLIPYIIGAILIFAGSQVTQIIYDAITKTNAG